MIPADDKAARHHPPLWTWAASLGLAGLILLGLVVWSNDIYSAYLRQHMALDRLAPPAKAGLPVVVAVGSSKTRCALDFDQDMEAELRNLGVEVRFIRITHFLATFDDLREVFDRLAQLHPRLVLIESDLLTFEPNVYRMEGYPAEDGWRRRARKSVTYLWKGNRAFGEPDPINDNENVIASRVTGCGVGNQEPISVYLSKLRGRRGSSEANRKPYLDEIERLKQGGTEVMMLEVPRSPEADTVFPRGLDAEAAASRAAVLRTGLLSEFWQQTPAVPQNEYLDTAHMTEAGRADYSRLFATRLATILQGPPK